MTHVAAPTQPVITFFFALFIVVALTIAGCSTTTISGPDLTPPEEQTVQEALPPAGPNAAHNEGANKEGKAVKHKSNGGTHN